MQNETEKQTTEERFDKHFLRPVTDKLGWRGQYIWEEHDLDRGEGVIEEIKGFIHEEITQAVQQAKSEERSIVRIELYQLDWIKALNQAIRTRPSSFGEEPIREWRNAADQLFGALMIEAEKKGIFPSPLQKPLATQPSTDERER